jgi:hypothetical protein
MTFDEQIKELVKGYDYAMSHTFMAGANAAREILQGQKDSMDCTVCNKLRAEIDYLKQTRDNYDLQEENKKLTALLKECREDLQEWIDVSDLDSIKTETLIDKLDDFLGEK